MLPAGSGMCSGRRCFFQFLLGCYAGRTPCAGAAALLTLSIPFRMLRLDLPSALLPCQQSLSIPFRMLLSLYSRVSLSSWYLFQFLLGCYLSGVLFFCVHAAGFQFLLGCYFDGLRTRNRQPGELSIPFRMLRGDSHECRGYSGSFQFLLGCYSQASTTCCTRTVRLSIPFRMLRETQQTSTSGHRG